MATDQAEIYEKLQKFVVQFLKIMFFFQKEIDKNKLKLDAS